MTIRPPSIKLVENFVIQSLFVRHCSDRLISSAEHRRTRRLHAWKKIGCCKFATTDWRGFRCQAGADQAALRAARNAGIATEGIAPQGWKTETGPALWLVDFGLVECDEPGYPARTVANVLGSDVTVWLEDWHSPGGRTTLDACRLNGKPFMIVYSETRPSKVAAWIKEQGARVVNIAGSRESEVRGIGERVERFLADVFAYLKN